MGYDRLWCGPHCHLQQGDGGGEGGHGGGRGVGARAGGGARVRHARGQRGAHRARAFTWVVRKHHQSPCLYHCDWGFHEGLRFEKIEQTEVDSNHFSNQVIM